MGALSNPKPASIPTFAYLDQIVTILGSTNTSFWPFLSAGSLASYVVAPYGASTQAANGNVLTPYVAGAAVGLSAQMEPHQHPSGVYSYRLEGATHILSAADAASLSFGDATVDSPFSIGIWALFEQALGESTPSFFAKYNTAGVLREYNFRLSATGKLIMELYDESTDDTEIATSTGTALTPWKWQFVTMTYDGGETAPVVNLYIDAVSVHDGTTVETVAGGGYTAMENTASVVTVGSAGVVATPTNPYRGRIALPFITGKALTVAEIGSLYNIGRILLGLA